MAGFPSLKSLEEFDFTFATGVPKKQVNELASIKNGGITVSWAFVGLRYVKKQSIKLRRRDYLKGLAYFAQVVVQLNWKNMDVSNVIET